VRYEGSREATLPAPLEQIPLLVKEGTALPMLLDPADTLLESEDPSILTATDNLAIKVFLPKNWKDLKRTKVLSTRILADHTAVDSTWEGDTCRIKISGETKRTYLILIPATEAPESCFLNGERIRLGSGDTFRFDDVPLELQVLCTAASVDLEIRY
jgi:alpha-glucosidase (family GH31 glycosyl hydrolase)